MTPMRRLIAKHMSDSRRTAAHCTTIVEVDMSRVAACRAELKEPMARRGVRLTYLAFVAGRRSRLSPITRSSTRRSMATSSSITTTSTSGSRWRSTRG